MTGMASNPDSFDVMAIVQLYKPFPQITVQYGLLVCVSPAPFLPALNPLDRILR
jgi:hypothetical protein